MLALAEELIGAAGERPTVAGIGFGGPVDLAQGRTRTSYLSAGWAGMALGEVVAEGLGITTWLANDADAGGLGEALFGAGAGAASVLYVNVGTGIGGAVVLAGRIHAGATSTAGEIGHVLVAPDGPECACGRRGCLQAVSAGPALAREASALAGEELTGRQVGEAAVAGDELAVAVVEEAARYLGIAIANAVNLIDPAVVVVGGGVAELGEVLMSPLREQYQARVLAPERRAAIVPAALGYDAGVIGAAAVALTEQGARSRCL